MEIERWDIFKEITMIHDEVDRIFQNFFKRIPVSRIDKETPSFTPPANIIDEGEKLVVQIALPGVKKEDIDLSLQDRTLIIRGMRVGRSDKPHYQQEWQYGSFEREIIIPVAIKDDDIRADYTDGILTIIVSKSDS